MTGCYHGAAHGEARADPRPGFPRCGGDYFFVLSVIPIVVGLTSRGSSESVQEPPELLISRMLAEAFLEC